MRLLSVESVRTAFVVSGSLRFGRTDPAEILQQVTVSGSWSLNTVQTDVPSPRGAAQPQYQLRSGLSTKRQVAIGTQPNGPRGRAPAEAHARGGEPQPHRTQPQLHVLLINSLSAWRLATVVLQMCEAAIHSSADPEHYLRIFVFIGSSMMVSTRLYQQLSSLCVLQLEFIAEDEEVTIVPYFSLDTEGSTLKCIGV